MRRSHAAVVAAVVGHVALTLGHGWVHATIPVPPADWQFGYVVTVLYALPLVGAGLVVGRDARPGARVLLVAGVAGFAYEGVFHFLLANPDHVGHVAEHTAAFGLTAVLSTAGNLLLVTAGWVVLRDSGGRASTTTADHAAAD